MNKGTVAFVHISPSGSTREVGRRICSYLAERGYEAAEFDVARYRGREGEVLRGVRESSLVLAGSPVYADHALRPLVSLLKSLPRGGGKPALAFVTYGEVSSGSSLYQMWKLLDGNGYRVQGLAEVLSVHSMMFRSGRPLGKGRPGEGDFEVLEGWIDDIAPRLEQGETVGIDASCVRPAGIDTVLDATVCRPEFMRYLWPNIRFRPEKCNSCGICRERCPAGRLGDLPRIDGANRCLYCYQCVRSCPEGAFDAPMWMVSPFVRAFSKLSGMRKRHSTRVYG